VHDVEVSSSKFSFLYCIILSVSIRPDWMRYRKDIPYA
jgi:hypothetical protein